MAADSSPPVCIQILAVIILLCFGVYSFIKVTVRLLILGPTWPPAHAVLPFLSAGSLLLLLQLVVNPGSCLSARHRLCCLSPLWGLQEEGRGGEEEARQRRAQRIVWGEVMKRSFRSIILNYFNLSQTADVTLSLSWLAAGWCYTVKRFCKLFMFYFDGITEHFLCAFIFQTVFIDRKHWFWSDQ